MNSSGEDRYFLINSREPAARYEIKPSENIITKKDLSRLKVSCTVIDKLQIKKANDVAITINARFKPFVSIQMLNHVFEAIKIQDYQDLTVISKEIKCGDRFVICNLEKFAMSIESDTFVLYSQK